MNIVNDIVKGASSQFGREFGRAGANKILKGANSYNINSENDYEGRIKPSDSPIVKSIKEIKKIKFVSTDKSNVSRLIEILDTALPHIHFNGLESLVLTDEYLSLVSIALDRYEHGERLISEEYEGKDKEYLNEKLQEFLSKNEEYSIGKQSFIKAMYEKEKLSKRSRKLGLILSFPILGALGIHKFYFGKTTQGIVYILFSITGIPGLLSTIEFLRILFSSKDKFDEKYNPTYFYYANLHLDS